MIAYFAMLSFFILSATLGGYIIDDVTSFYGNNDSYFLVPPSLKSLLVQFDPQTPEYTRYQAMYSINLTVFVLFSISVVISLCSSFMLSAHWQKKEITFDKVTIKAIFIYTLVWIVTYFFIRNMFMGSIEPNPATYTHRVMGYAFGLVLVFFSAAALLLTVQGKFINFRR